MFANFNGYRQRIFDSWHKRIQFIAVIHSFSKREERWRKSVVSLIPGRQRSIDLVRLVASSVLVYWSLVKIPLVRKIAGFLEEPSVRVSGVAATAVIYWERANPGFLTSNRVSCLVGDDFWDEQNQQVSLLPDFRFSCFIELRLIITEANMIIEVCPLSRKIKGELPFTSTIKCFLWICLFYFEIRLWMIHLFV